MNVIERIKRIEQIRKQQEDSLIGWEGAPFRCAYCIHFERLDLGESLEEDYVDAQGGIHARCLENFRIKSWPCLDGTSTHGPESGFCEEYNQDEMDSYQ